ncbi:hypothetical protein HK405_003176, partial [Cladochytrium tenue]
MASQSTRRRPGANAVEAAGNAFSIFTPNVFDFDGGVTGGDDEGEDSDDDHVAGGANLLFDEEASVPLVNAHVQTSVGASVVSLSSPVVGSRIVPDPSFTQPCSHAILYETHKLADTHTGTMANCAVKDARLEDPLPERQLAPTAVDHGITPLLRRRVEDLQKENRDLRFRRAAEFIASAAAAKAVKPGKLQDRCSEATNGSDATAKDATYSAVAVIETTPCVTTDVTPTTAAATVTTVASATQPVTATVAPKSTFVPDTAQQVAVPPASTASVADDPRRLLAFQSLELDALVNQNTHLRTENRRLLDLVALLQRPPQPVPATVDAVTQTSCGFTPPTPLSGSTPARARDERTESAVRVFSAANPPRHSTRPARAASSPSPPPPIHTAASTVAEDAARRRLAALRFEATAKLAAIPTPQSAAVTTLTKLVDAALDAAGLAAAGRRVQGTLSDAAVVAAVDGAHQSDMPETAVTIARRAVDCIDGLADALFRAREDRPPPTPPLPPPPALPPQHPLSTSFHPQLSTSANPPPSTEPPAPRPARRSRSAQTDPPSEIPSADAAAAAAESQRLQLMVLSLSAARRRAADLDSQNSALRARCEDLQAELDTVVARRRSYQDPTPAPPPLVAADGRKGRKDGPGVEIAELAARLHRTKARLDDERLKYRKAKALARALGSRLDAAEAAAAAAAAATLAPAPAPPACGTAKPRLPMPSDLVPAAAEIGLAVEDVDVLMAVRRERDELRHARREDEERHA